MSSQWSPPTNYESRPICVLGGGVLGRRIAACFVAAGWQVRIRDPSAKSRDDAVKYITENLSSFSALIATPPKSPGACEAFEDLVAAVKDCWLVLEAVPEILPLKECTFADLEKHAPTDCILATNSSSFKSGELLSKCKESTKTRVLNTHFMMPPQVITLQPPSVDTRINLLAGNHRRTDDQRTHRSRDLPVCGSQTQRSWSASGNSFEGVFWFHFQSNLGGDQARSNGCAG